MKFCHIAPTPLVPVAASYSDCFLTLAHLIEKDEQYVRHYKEAKQIALASGRDIVSIMDNSGFEYYKEHGPGYVFNPDKLVEQALKIGADYVVLPDYPGEESTKTIEAAYKYESTFKDAELGTFFVPQSKPGDLEDYISAVQWAANENFVDYIGISILGVPIAFDVEQGNKLQRYCSRHQLMSILQDRGILNQARYNGKKIHFLGMVDGPNEITLCGEFIKEGFIDTWDSSSAVWAACCGKRYDNSPTGLVDGKIETPVDFSIGAEKITPKVLDDIVYNCLHINQQVNRFSRKRGELLW